MPLSTAALTYLFLCSRRAHMRLLRSGKRSSRLRSPLVIGSLIASPPARVVHSRWSVVGLAVAWHARRTRQSPAARPRAVLWAALLLSRQQGVTNAPHSGCEPKTNCTPAAGARQSL